MASGKRKSKTPETRRKSKRMRTRNKKLDIYQLGDSDNEEIVLGGQSKKDTENLCSIDDCLEMVEMAEAEMNWWRNMICEDIVSLFDPPKIEDTDINFDQDIDDHHYSNINNEHLDESIGSNLSGINLEASLINMYSDTIMEECMHCMEYQSDLKSATSQNDQKDKLISRMKDDIDKL